MAQPLNPLHMVAPKECLTCGFLGCLVCNACLLELESIADLGCRQCGNPQVHEDSMSCQWCSRLRLTGDPVVSLFAYRGTGRVLLQKVKFEGYWPLIKPLLRQGAAGFYHRMPFLSFACLVPIPESLSGMWRRHFNPAQKLVQQLSLLTGLPQQNLLSIRLPAKHQVGLTLDERRRNARNRFRVRNKRLPESVILVDDVITTGATMESCHKTLLDAGVKRVAWCSLFRTL